MISRLHLVSAGCLAIAATMVFAAPGAHASLLTVGAPSCSANPESQTFLPWADPADYFLAPDGNFASAAGWTLGNGATVVAGGDGYSLGGNGLSTQSLALADGSSASTAEFCVGINSPSIRFVARNSGLATSTLQVSATVETSAGFEQSVIIGDVSAGSAWNVTSPLALAVNTLPLLSGSETPITVSFAPQGQGGRWQIDDLYVDPWTRGGGG